MLIGMSLAESMKHIEPFLSQRVPHSEKHKAKI